MTLEYFEGFDAYADAEDDGLYAGATPWNDTGTPVATFVSGRFYGQALQVVQDAVNEASYYTHAADSEQCMGFAVKAYNAITAGSASGYHHFIRLTANTTNRYILAVEATDGYLQLQDSGGSELATSTDVDLTDGEWHYVEIRLLVDASGAVQVWVDGTLRIDYSADTSSNTVNRIMFTGWYTDASNRGGHAFDDFYYKDDGTPLGPSRVVELVPTSDTGPNTGTPSTGVDHYALVDDLPHDDGTTYIEFTANGQERFGVQTLDEFGWDPETIHGVLPSFTGQEAVSGTASWDADIETSGGDTEIDANKQFGSLGSRWYREPQNGLTSLPVINPDDSQPWEKSDLAALSIVFDMDGYSSGTIHLTSASLMVLGSIAENTPPAPSADRRIVTIIN